MFEASSASDETLQTTLVDTTAEIRYVSMRIHTHLYTGLRFFALNDLTLDMTWYDAGEWTPLQAVPAD